MSIRQRTTKLIARRHDLNYFKRGSKLRMWQWWLAGAALAAAVVWFAGTTFVHGSAAFSAGPMSAAHAVIGAQCEQCHVPVVKSTSWTPSFLMRKSVPDAACLSCHTATPHHPQQVKMTPACSSCHVEHAGAMHLAAVADTGCTQCHAKLESRTGMLPVTAVMHSFATDHPEFGAPRRPMEEQEESPLIFSHAAHMQKELSGPKGKVMLRCGDCHEAKMEAVAAFAPNVREPMLRQGAGMMPVSYEKSCRSCHALEFDRHVGEAPHKDVDTVRTFVEQQIGDFAKTHPQVVAEEIKNWPALQPLPEKVSMAAPRNAQEWVTDEVSSSKKILWRERCGLCHVERSAEFPEMPAGRVAEIGAPMQPHARLVSAMFSHAAHSGVSCESCHTKALTSVKGTDVLMPSIATCRKCHDGQSSPQGPAVKAGHAESGCSLCHVYHGADVVSVPVEGKKLEELVGRGGE